MEDQTTADNPGLMRSAPTPAPLDELAVRFTYHPPTRGQPERYGRIRVKALELARLVEAEVPPSREQSLAWTAIEEAVMWANAGIARRDG